MGLPAYPPSSTEERVVNNLIRLAGAGAAAPTIVRGKQVIGPVTVRTAVGTYVLTFPDKPGILLAAPWSFEAATPINVAGASAVCAQNVAARTVTVFCYAAGALRELAATETLCLALLFSRKT